MNSLISFFTSDSETSFIFCTSHICMHYTSIVSNELLLSFSVSLETKVLIWSSTLGDRILLNKLVLIIGVAIIVGM